MAKVPPPLSIVSGAKVGVEPPRPLGRHGHALWQRVQAEYGITDVGGVELLAQVCQAEDRAEQLADVVARDGHTIYTRAGVPKSHPAIRDELACRAFIVRVLERLGLNVEAIKPPGRPPGNTGGWRP